MHKKLSPNNNCKTFTVNVLTDGRTEVPECKTKDDASASCYFNITMK